MLPHFVTDGQHRRTQCCRHNVSSFCRGLSLTGLWTWPLSVTQGKPGKSRSSALHLECRYNYDTACPLSCRYLSRLLMTTNQKNSPSTACKSRVPRRPNSIQTPQPVKRSSTWWRATIRTACSRLNRRWPTTPPRRRGLSTSPCAAARASWEDSLSTIPPRLPGQRKEPTTKFRPAVRIAVELSRAVVVFVVVFVVAVVLSLLLSLSFLSLFLLLSLLLIWLLLFLLFLFLPASQWERRA